MSARRYRSPLIASGVVAILIVLGIVLALVVSSNSSSAKKVRVPDVTGQKQDAALALLGQDGFSTQTTSESNAQTSSGEIVRTMPPAGSEAAPHSTVVVVVSSGPTAAAKPVTVPKVAGMSFSDALTTLGAQGLTTSVSTQPSSTTPSGSVIATNPPAGSRVPAHSAVTVVVSSGP